MTGSIIGINSQKCLFINRVFINEFEADNVGVGGKLLMDRQKKEAAK